jgi:hypothetical protein
MLSDKQKAAIRNEVRRRYREAIETLKNLGVLVQKRDKNGHFLKDYEFRTSPHVIVSKVSAEFAEEVYATVSDLPL